MSATSAVTASGAELQEVSGSAAIAHTSSMTASGKTVPFWAFEGDTLDDDTWGTSERSDILVAHLDAVQDIIDTFTQ